MGLFKKAIGKLLSGSGGGIINTLGDVADKFIQTPEEKAEFQLALRRADMDMQKLAMEAEGMYTKDRQSAREMYMSDSSLQKIFAIVFLVGYFAITGFLIYAIFFSSVFRDMQNWEVALISTIFTAMSGKINTIVDFLFGGSKKDDKSAERMDKALEDRSPS